MTDDTGRPGEAGNRYRIAFLGFGEAAGAFARGLDETAPVAITAYDVKTERGGQERDGKLADYASAKVAGCPTHAEAFATAQAVFSLVTADQAFDAARAAAAHLAPGTLFLDANSCSPQTKQRSAAIVEAAGARYVDVAVMAPVYPLRHKTPLLISGPHAAAALDLARGLGLAAKDAEGDVGRASSIKLVRSIMMKGLEALSVELRLAGRKLGVEDVVLASLEQTYPGFGWDKRTGYMLERVMVHGLRRAAEMDEAAKMVAELGLPPGIVAATADLQRCVGELGLKHHAAVAEGVGGSERADAILEGLAGRGRTD